MTYEQVKAQYDHAIRVCEDRGQSLIADRLRLQRSKFVILPPEDIKRITSEDLTSRLT